MSTQSFETQYASERLIMNHPSWTISDYNQFFYNIEIGKVVQDNDSHYFIKNPEYEDDSDDDSSNSSLHYTTVMSDDEVDSDDDSDDDSKANGANGIWLEEEYDGTFKYRTQYYKDKFSKVVSQINTANSCIVPPSDWVEYANCPMLLLSPNT